MITNTAKDIIKKGEIVLEVNRSGITQKLTFKIKRIKVSNVEYVELFSDKLVGFSELQRLSNETGLPIESNNIKAFPTGLGIKDFINL